MAGDADDHRENVDNAEAHALWESAVRLGSGPQLRCSMINELLAHVSDRTDHLSAETAIYALGFSRVPKRRLHEVVVRLLDVVDDVTRLPRVRAQAAEGVGDLLECTKQARLRRHATLRLVEHLADDEVEVRFWTAFSLGKLRARSARSALRALVDDTAVVPGWWSVGDEAADALDTIAGRGPAPREMLGSLTPTSTQMV